MPTATQTHQQPVTASPVLRRYVAIYQPKAGPRSETLEFESSAITFERVISHAKLVIPDGAHLSSVFRK